jgi:fanconi-associated nuclease 1
MTVQQSTSSQSGVASLTKHPRSPVAATPVHDLAASAPRSPLRKKVKSHGRPEQDVHVDVDADLLGDHQPDDQYEGEKQSALEAALPAVRIDEEAIEEYEASQSQRIEAEQSAADRLTSRKWVRGKSSIYVDAFDLALDTVLEEESCLFGNAELELFRHWRELSYEAKYL